MNTEAEPASTSSHNRNPSPNEALAALVAALIAKGDLAGAARMIAAFEAPVAPERTATVTDLASRRVR